MVTLATNQKTIFCTLFSLGFFFQSLSRNSLKKTHFGHGSWTTTQQKSWKKIQMVPIKGSLRPDISLDTRATSWHISFSLFCRMPSCEILIVVCFKTKEVINKSSLFTSSNSEMGKQLHAKPALLISTIITHSYHVLVGLPWVRIQFGARRLSHRPGK